MGVIITPLPEGGLIVKLGCFWRGGKGAAEKGGGGGR